jgi:hypothetical protein
VNLSEAAKRILIGRKMASHQLGETLPPKRIALPVFASDALSSVAYAPDEILLTLSLAGMAAFAYSWKIGLLVAAVMLVVVGSILAKDGYLPRQLYTRGDRLAYSNGIVALALVAVGQAEMDRAEKGS